MRQYEVVYIMDPMLEEAQQSALVERFRTLVETQGAEVQHVDRWERRRLAFEVKGRREGFYVVMNFQGEPAAEKELDRVLGITDGIIRHMIVRLDERKAAKAIAEAKAAAEAKARAEAEARAAAEAAAAQAAAEAAELEANAPAANAPAASAPAADAGDAATGTAGETTQGGDGEATGAV